MNAKNWIRCPINTESKGITFVNIFHTIRLIFL